MENSLFVPVNHESILKENKKRGKIIGFLCLFCLVMFVGMTIMAALAGQIVAASMFVAFDFFILIYAVVSFNQGKYNSKNEKLIYKYDFMGDSLIVSKNSNKNLETFKIEHACLYRPYGNKQYIAKVYESSNDLTFKLRVGSSNFIPVYRKVILPKSVLTNTEGYNNLISQLKQVFGQDYIVKNQ
ncbi:MAG: hypothetical protein IKT33_00720 [Clostridia bacterium]|nr:hypothetical protein [Clostridia bacterium]